MLLLVLFPVLPFGEGREGQAVISNSRQSQAACHEDVTHVSSLCRWLYIKTMRTLNKARMSTGGVRRAAAPSRKRAQEGEDELTSSTSSSDVTQSEEEERLSFGEESGQVDTANETGEVSKPNANIPEDPTAALIELDAEIQQVATPVQTILPEVEKLTRELQDRPSPNAEHAAAQTSGANQRMTTPAEQVAASRLLKELNTAHNVLQQLTSSSENDRVSLATVRIKLHKQVEDEADWQQHLNRLSRDAAEWERQLSRLTAEAAGREQRLGRLSAEAASLEKRHNTRCDQVMMLRDKVGSMHGQLCHLLQLQGFTLPAEHQRRAQGAGQQRSKGLGQQQGAGKDAKCGSNSNEHQRSRSPGWRSRGRSSGHGGRASERSPRHNQERSVQRDSKGNAGGNDRDKAAAKVSPFASGQQAKQHRQESGGEDMQPSAKRQCSEERRSASVAAATGDAAAAHSSKSKASPDPKRPRHAGASSSAAVAPASARAGALVSKAGQGTSGRAHHAGASGSSAATAAPAQAATAQQPATPASGRVPAPSAALLAGAPAPPEPAMTIEDDHLQAEQLCEEWRETMQCMSNVQLLRWMRKAMISTPLPKLPRSESRDS